MGIAAAANVPGAGVARGATPTLAAPPKTARHRQIWHTMPVSVQIAAIVLVLIALSAIFAPLLAPRDPIAQALLTRLTPPVGVTGGSWRAPLGTDQLGRDVLSRVLYGARISLGIGLLGMTIGLVLGTTVGLIAGFLRGRTDEALMLLVDTNLALPTIVLALTAIALFGTGLVTLILVVGISGWEQYARLGRGMVLSAREQLYVEAARVAGVGPGRLLTRHILPNVAAPLIVLATLQLTGVILLEASLSFLGVGVQPPTPSWGSMVGEGRDYLNTAWWIAVAPGAAIVATTMAISLIGDWLRDALDPTLRRS
jgi:peptide/nickel transport system permease protein